MKMGPKVLLIFALALANGALSADRKNFAFSQVELDLMKTWTGNTDRAVTFSPVSIRTLLGMLKAGARDKTAAELDRVVENECSLINAIRSKPDQGIYMGNAVFLSNTMDVNEHFKNVTTDQYNAQFRYSFVDNKEKFAHNINEWVKKITHKNINEVQNAQTMDSNIDFVIANAIHLVAKWKEPFESTETRNSVFYESSGSELRPKMAPIMRHKKDYRMGHVDSLEARVIEMPFKTPNNYAMYIVLPNKANGLKEMVNKMTKKSLGEILGSIPESTNEISLYLPKFKASITEKIGSLLPQRLSDEMFSSNAKFTGISGNNIKVTNVLHKAVLNVDEEGAVGSAVTIAEAINLSFSVPIVFNATHPFMYFITEMQAKDNCPTPNVELFFMGFVGKLENTQPLPSNWGPIGPKEDYRRRGN